MTAQVTLPSGEQLPALGLGTWRMGEVAAQRGREVAAVGRALALGYRLIDTAEMYGEGGAERIVGEALTQAIQDGTVSRGDVFLVSKVYPHHASRSGVVDACRRSLERLEVETIDLYLLHWRGTHPLSVTIEGFEELRSRGWIRHWGVSNFDLADMEELWRLPAGRCCATNQVYYSLTQRGPEFDLLPWQREHAIPVMAYSPIDQGRLAASRRLHELAHPRGIGAATLALAWLMNREGVIAIPKAVREAHLRENLAAGRIVLEAEELAALDGEFPPPKAKSPLAML